MRTRAASRRRSEPGPGAHARPTARAPSLPARAAETAARALATGGSPLPSPVRDYFEARFGRDLSRVRLHDGPAAAQAAAAIGARAYALGDHIALGLRAPSPETPAGRRLLAHELAHVAQSSPADRTIRRQPEESTEEIARKAAVAEAIALLQSMEEEEAKEKAEAEKEVKEPSRIPQPSLLSLTADQMCGGKCFTDQEIYAELERSRAEDAAAEARATSERKRRRDVRAHGTKQQKWELEWEQRYYQYKNVGAVAGRRDSGTMTPMGIRVPAEQGNLLAPRPFYEREMAGFLAWQGFIHYAEIVEAGHDAAARELALKTNGGFPLKDDKLNLAGYTGWAYKAKAARESVQAAMVLASGITAVQQALARTASSTLAGNFTRIAGQPATGAGATMTVEGVYFGGVTVTRSGGQYFTSYDMIQNVGRVAGQGKAMHNAFELGTVQAARAAGATTARVGVSNVVNKTWEAHLKSQGYWWEFIEVGPNRFTGFWTKVFNL